MRAGRSSTKFSKAETDRAVPPTAKTVTRKREAPFLFLMRVSETSKIPVPSKGRMAFENKPVSGNFAVDLR